MTKEKEINFNQLMFCVREIQTAFFNKQTAEKKFEVLSSLVEKKDKRSLAKSLKFEEGSRSFSEHIFELISKAQSTPENYYRLRMGFPDYVEMWEEWQETEKEEDFFNKYLTKAE